MSTVDPDLSEINGISLYTQSGKRKKSFSAKDRLTIAGASHEHLKVFCDWFCPYHPSFATTKSGANDARAWVMVKGRLRHKDVLRHLLGDVIPGVEPKWVAPWGAKYTRWIGIDIDFRGDEEDFKQRVAIAKWAMKTLGYPESGPLWSPTPSGGLHVRGFVRGTMFTYQVPLLFQNLGIENEPGRLEIFPQHNRGLRLPFGKIPGLPFDPTEWVQFVERLSRKGEVCLRKQSDMTRLSEGYLSKSLTRGNDPAYPTYDQEEHRKYSAPSTEESPQSSTRTHRPQQVLVHDQPLEEIRCPADAEELYRRGIWRPGMRVEATVKLAWHFIKVKGCSAAETTALLTDWCYETGKLSSKDVLSDIDSGTSKVAEQVAQIVNWTVSVQTTGRVRPVVGIYPGEIDRLLYQIPSVGEEMRRDFSFICRMLQFAKVYGKREPTRWVVSIGVQGVFRTWPGCSGMRYKAPLVALQKYGVVSMIEEKIQSPDKTGRPRLWGIFPSPYADSGSKELGEVPMSCDDAVAYVVRKREEREAKKRQAELWNAERHARLTDGRGYRSNRDVTSRIQLEADIRRQFQIIDSRNEFAALVEGKREENVKDYL